MEKNWTNRERKLVDICFQTGIMIHSHPELKNKSIEEIAAWISKQLNDNEYYNHPVGSSWGSLMEKETYDKMTKK